MGLDPAAIQERRWRQHPYDGSRFAHIRGMITLDEQRMLRWLSHHAGPDGCLIDAGAFLGRSAAHLADGILDHPNPRKKVYSFDRFSVSPYARDNFPELAGVESTFALYAANIAPWAHRIVVEAGDIRDSDWQPRPIEILFLDLAKAPEVNDWCVRTFFPQLIPGRSIVIQQDFLHPHLPWIHVAMGRFRDYFRYLADTGTNSVVYLCERAVPLSEAQGFEYHRFCRSERERLFDLATAAFESPQQRTLLRSARAKLAA